jgi:6-pyruvoyltetrahydropterin/6-carboxytetrahydropterin synthase
MKKTKVTKIFYFCAGHQLPGHPGLCSNVHGHNYKLEVTVKGHVINDMVIDYGDLKAWVNPIVKEFDHAFILSEHSPNWLRNGLCASSMKIVNLGERATTENIAKCLKHRIEVAIDDWVIGMNNPEINENLYTVSLKLWESESSFCEVK